MKPVIGAMAFIMMVSAASAESSGAGACKPGLVWREAAPFDHVCVTPAERADAQRQNAEAESHKSPTGGIYGPNTCLPGYIWRGAFRGDLACVTPAERETARLQNDPNAERNSASQPAQVAVHTEAVMPRNATVIGPESCAEGFVWRETVPMDHVCVPPLSRTLAQEENGLAASRRIPNVGPWGPNTCRDGFVWRLAFPGDVVCVVPSRRSDVAEENALGPRRRAAP